MDSWISLKLRGGTAALGAAGSTPLPCSGGLLDQPAALMDALTLLDGMAATGFQD